MHTYTALYDTREEAERVQAQLQSLGIIDADGNSLHDRSSAGLTDDPNSGANFGQNLPEEDRHLYKEALRRGGFLLTVNVDDERSDEVRRLLDGSGAVDIDTREAEYRKEGVLDRPTGALGAAGAAIGGAAAKAGDKIEDAFDGDRSDRTDTNRLSASSATGEQAIPIVQEELRIGKRAVERGGVRVRAYTVERPVNEQVTLREEHVNIERRPVDQKLGAVDANLLQERTIEVTETAEEAVVAKEARVVEEVVVNKTATERTENVQDTVRHTEVDVERLPGSTTDRPLNR